MPRRRLDLTNQQFGRLTAIRDVGHRHGQRLWLCVCQCGNETEVIASNLIRTRSCGCLKNKPAWSRLDLSGHVFGRLTAVRDVGRKGSNREWLCACDCGGEVVVPTGHLRSGHTRSCGCINIDTPPNTKHGMKGTRLYQVWKGMRQRCQNKKNHAYPSYGGRGIQICDEWQDFEVFHDWAVSNGHSEDLTLDRIDNDGNYEPANCRWATWQEQASNKRGNVKLTHDGKTQTVAKWSRETGIKRKTLYYRANAGWNAERALTLIR